MTYQPGAPFNQYQPWYNGGNVQMNPPNPIGYYTQPPNPPNQNPIRYNYSQPLHVNTNPIYQPLQQTYIQSQHNGGTIS